MIKIQEEELIEITDRELKERFIRYLYLSIRFSDENSDHFARMAISKAIPESLQLWMKYKEDGLFYISAHCETDLSSVTSQWIHDDFIHSIRNIHKDAPDHLIHTTDCMTDIYREAIGEIKKTKEKEGVDG